MKVSEGLAKVRDLYRVKKNWVQGSYRKRIRKGGDDYVCYCLAGGLDKYFRDGPGRSTAGRIVREAIADLHPDRTPMSSIEGWNDAPGRTITEIRAVAKRAVEIARLEEKAAA
jgi:hypothetical protein